jgi:formate dehydrogenase subunit gamma
MRKQNSFSKPRNRKRAILITLMVSLLVLMVSLAMPLTGYLAQQTGLIQVAQAQESDEEVVNPRAEYWRAVREGNQGYSAVSGQETGVLIQNGGQNWRELRNGPLIFWGGWFVIAVVIAIAAKHLIKGKDKLEAGRSGRTILRWSAFERVMHWFVAISFVILAITGLSLLFGRTVLIPVIGKEGFAAWAQLAKPVHDYLAVPFIAGLVLMLVLWLPKNIMKSYDFKWLRNMGGYFGKSHDEAPAGFANGGEKIFYWILFVGGIALTISGFYLLFPNLGTEREAMQFWNLVHGVSGVFLIAVSLGHIYLGTIGVEGVFEGMWSGDVDENFAKQHHGLWYEEVKGGAAPPEQGKTAPGTSSAATT